MQRMEAKLASDTGIAKAQRDFDIKKGISLTNTAYHIELCKISNPHENVLFPHKYSSLFSALSFKFRIWIKLV